MIKAGILMHGRHLQTIGWERLVWGVPVEDSLGSLPKVVELLLNESAETPYSTIVFGCGPSVHDGLSEGAYTKKYLLDHLHELRAFPRFAHLNSAALNDLRARLQDVIVTEAFIRSVDEIAIAAQLFSEHEVTQVTQVTAASHAPRCQQLQSAARAVGHIPKGQQWALVADDRFYEGADAFSTVIFEPPHRADDPMLSVTPSISEALRGYHYGLSAEQKETLITMVRDYMERHARVVTAHTMHESHALASKAN